MPNENDDKEVVLKNVTDPGLDHDPILGDAEDPAEDPQTSLPIDGGQPIPTSEISGEVPDPTAADQPPISGGVKWRAPNDPVTGYDNVRDRERASQFPELIRPHGI